MKKPRVRIGAFAALVVVMVSGCKESAPEKGGGKATGDAAAAAATDAAAAAKQAPLDAAAPTTMAAPAKSSPFPRAEDVLPSGEVSKGSVVVAGEGYRFQAPAGSAKSAHPGSSVAAVGTVKGMLGTPAQLTMYVTTEPFKEDVAALAESQRAAAKKAGKRIVEDTGGFMSIAGRTARGWRLAFASADLLEVRSLLVHDGKAYTLHIETPYVEHVWANLGADLMIKAITLHVAPPPAK